MAKYIDREAVLKRALLDITRLSDNAWQRGYWHGVDVMAEFIKEQPTADVAEVRHSEWEETDWVEYDGHGECIHYPKQGLCCSSCCHVFKKELLYKDNFCPNCGADMRGGKGGTNEEQG